MAKRKVELRFLRYKGVLYRKYVMARCGTLFIQLKGRLKRKNAHPRGDYVGYNVTCPLTGKPRWVQRHRATLETFDPFSDPTMVACHNEGTKKSDGYFGSCTRKTQKGNRLDRVRDGTQSTGHDMVPGKLAVFVDQILRLYDEKGLSQSELAEIFECSRQAIRYRLKQNGRLL